MARLSLMAAAALALVASPPFLCATTAPVSAQEWRDDDAQRDQDEMHSFLRDELRARRDRRDEILDLLRERRDRREALMDLVRARAEARDDDWDRGDLRERLREGLRERFAERHGEDGWHRGFRERFAGRFGEDGWRHRLRERIAERRGGEEGDCYFLTRSLRDEDGDFLVVVRRRICRD